MEGLGLGLGMGCSGGRSNCRRGRDRQCIGGALLLWPRTILLSAPLLCSCAGRLLRSRLWPSAGWGRSRLLHAALQVVRFEERNLSWDRWLSSSVPLMAPKGAIFLDTTTPDAEAEFWPPRHCDGLHRPRGAARDV
jgi:hypothetical protein